MAEVGAEISFRAFQGLRLVKAEPGVQSKIPAGNGSAHLAPRTYTLLHGLLVFALAVHKARPPYAGLLLTAQTFLFLIFHHPQREAISKSCLNHCRGSQSQIRGPPLTSPPSPVWSERITTHHRSPVPLLHPPHQIQGGPFKV